VNVSGQNQNLTGFSEDNSENRCMNPVPCTACLLIHVEAMKIEKATRKGDRKSEEPVAASLLHLRDSCYKCSLSFFFSFVCTCNYIPLVEAL
jgi:hypothetical protein